MSEYTPTTDAVRKGYSYVPELPKGARHHPPLIAEFDRWLNSVKAEVWDEGNYAESFNRSQVENLRAGFLDAELFENICKRNPYRTGGAE